MRLIKPILFVAWYLFTAKAYSDQVWIGTFASNDYGCRMLCCRYQPVSGTLKITIPDNNTGKSTIEITYDGDYRAGETIKTTMAMPKWDNKTTANKFKFGFTIEDSQCVSFQATQFKFNEYLSGTYESSDPDDEGYFQLRPTPKED